MENSINEITTQLTLNLDQLQALVVAISDSTQKCEHVLSFDVKEVAKNMQSLDPDNPFSPEQCLEYAQQQHDMASSLLTEYQVILKEINEIYPELEAKEDASKKIIITKF